MMKVVGIGKEKKVKNWKAKSSKSIKKKERKGKEKEAEEEKKKFFFAPFLDPSLSSAIVNKKIGRLQ